MDLIIVNVGVHKCAPCSELPSNISTIEYTLLVSGCLRLAREVFLCDPLVDVQVGLVMQGPAVHLFCQLVRYSASYSVS